MDLSIQSNHSAIISDLSKPPQWIPHKLRQLTDDDVLIQVEATTINPSDLLSIEGSLVYRHQKLPLVGGKQGAGRVLKAGNNVKQFEGKRVCFCCLIEGGGWSNFIVIKTEFVFIIDQDVSVSSAASGIVNPLTVLGFLSELERKKITSIIHTAAASALGRMLNKICRTRGITLLNIVRKQEQAELLKNQGAEHVIVTTGEWEKTYAQKISQLNSKGFFDALGGGDVQATLIKYLPGDAFVFVYGLLESNDPAKLTQIPSTNLISGLTVRGFGMYKWFLTLDPNDVKDIREKYSAYLKTDLSSITAKEFKLSQIVEAIQEYKKNPTQGKILLRP